MIPKTNIFVKLNNFLLTLFPCSIKSNSFCFPNDYVINFTIVNMIQCIYNIIPIQI